MLDDHQLFLDKARRITLKSRHIPCPISWREIGEGLGFSRYSTFEILMDLHKDGYITFMTEDFQDFCLTKSGLNIHNWPSMLHSTSN